MCADQLLSAHHRELEPKVSKARMSRSGSTSWSASTCTVPRKVGAVVRRVRSTAKGVPCLIAVDKTRPVQGEALGAVLPPRASVAPGAGVITTNQKTKRKRPGRRNRPYVRWPRGIGEDVSSDGREGYPPERPTSRCGHEFKLIVDLMYEGGIRAE